MTGKPVYIFYIPPSRKTKFEEFFQYLLSQRRIRLFDADVGQQNLDWNKKPFDETSRIAQEVMDRLAW